MCWESECQWDSDHSQRFSSLDLSCVLKPAHNRCWDVCRGIKASCLLTVLLARNMIRPLVLVLTCASIATSFSSYGSLAGLSELEQEAIISTLQIHDDPWTEPPPGPLPYDGTKLVNDKDHPFEELRVGDIRGPSPGLNTLASHGVC